MKNKRSREDWKNEIGKYKSSGLSINGYCRESNINPSTFIYWKKKFDSPAIVVPHQLLVKISTPIKSEEKMKLSYNQIVIEFPVELTTDEIAVLISALKEVSL
ncbi:hypothetical protein [Oceanispirochaeta sp.]|jgi:hypothetical protein|uniref:IS66 family insertion sequence element accessory protein TnpA n=1 Tax=Oceanispirochaeta sp. TaxID=2035350 RepID=UPI0026141D89|nr:hypothetical protein [Oceanispirochaeta sp.]MDA3957758.1 hypothetical protein [Oceanispirochaeta sp.]